MLNISQKFCFIVLMFFLMLVWKPAQLIGDNALEVYNLRTEYKTNPVGIDIFQPRFSWEIRSDKKNTMQTRYQLRCALSKNDLRAEDDLLWKEREDSDQSIHVVYDGPEIESGQRVYWQVKIWDNHGRESDWSKPAFWEMGLLESADWKAKWIEANIQEEVKNSQPAQYFRKEFKISSPVKSARLYITSHGLYEAWLNGKRIGDQVFTPGWTSYNKRIQYQVYDVTDLVHSGENAIGVILGDGWYRGYLGWKDRRNVYGEKLALLARLELKLENGTKKIITTDNSWRATNEGPIRSSDIYMGEIYDARKELTGWNEVGEFKKGWSKVIEKEYDKENLIAAYGPPIRIIEDVQPISISIKDDCHIVDMGQNMVGWIRLKVNAGAGTKIVLRHAEVLDKDGNFYTENLRSAKQEVTYICKGNGQEVFEPHFTFQGFRYVEVSGWPGKLEKSMLTGKVIHSDMPVTGNFSCSDSLINQLQHNILWGLKGNFLDVPTDCPQRDERLGWTGDAQVFAPTACFNVDAASFYTKWLKDLALDQDEEGKVNDVVPDVLNGGGGHTGWADAAVVVPWTVYLNYGDKRILEEQYASMKAWVEYMKVHAGEDFIWDGDWHYGDWLSFDDDSPAYMGAYTETDLIATAYFAYSSTLFSRIASILGRDTDAGEYAELATDIKKAFQYEFLTPAGRLVSNTQTAYTLALAFDLIPDELKQKTAQYLYHNVNRFKHITTGFLGTPLICKTLTANGYPDMAYMLLNRKEYPSWLYPVTMGATTIWERWDGIKPDSTFQNPGMNSFNHYAYGAIGEWLYSTLAGIRIDEKNPGYKHIIIEPRPGGEVHSAHAEIKTMYGKASSSWQLKEDRLRLVVHIPANSSGEVILPAGTADSMREDGVILEVEGDFLEREIRDGKLVLRIGSGSYTYEIPAKLFNNKLWNSEKM